MQLARTRQQHASARVESSLSSLMLLLLRFRPPAAISIPKPPLPPASRQVEPAATLPGSSRPSPHHIGKWTLVCRLKLVAKK